MSFEIYKVENEFFRKILILIFVSRPILWFLSLHLFLFGFIYSKATFSFDFLISLFFICIPINLVVYGFNDIYDYHSDKRNPRKKLWQGIVLKPKYHNFVFRSIIITSSLILLISYFFLNLYSFIIALLMIILSYLYSVPPFRFKTKPPIDSIVNGIGYFLFFVLGYSLIGDIDFSNKMYLFILGFIGIFIYSTITDYERDKEAGDKTFAVIFGKKISILVSLIIFSLMLYLGNFETKAINYGIGLIMTIMFINLFFLEKIFTFNSSMIFIIIFLIELYYFFFFWMPNFLY